MYGNWDWARSEALRHNVIATVERIKAAAMERKRISRPDKTWGSNIQPFLQLRRDQSAQHPDPLELSSRAAHSEAARVRNYLGLDDDCKKKEGANFRRNDIAVTLHAC